MEQMKEEIKYIQIETKTHAERLLKAELDAILITLNQKAKKGLDNQSSSEPEISMRKAAKEVEDSLNLLLTHRKYIENPEEYKIKKSVFTDKPDCRVKGMSFDNENNMPDVDFEAIGVDFQELFNHMSEAHDLILTQDEMWQIVNIVKKLK